MQKQEPIQTTIINIFGGPGSGKSSTAAKLFNDLKQKGFQVEMVREVIKDWAWQGRIPKDLDQHFIFAQQAHQESIMFGKVQYIITDSPVLLSVYYSNPQDIIGDSIEAAYQAYLRMLEKHNVHLINIVLKRKPLPEGTTFHTNGRFHNEEESKEIDKDLTIFLKKHNMEFETLGYFVGDYETLFYKIIS
ncbi:MAG: AAA family ATPase [Promethearchaeota archaeon]